MLEVPLHSKKGGFGTPCQEATAPLLEVKAPFLGGHSVSLHIM